MEEMAVPRRTSTSSSSDEFGMDFHPLLSPPSVDEGREGKRGSSSSLQWPPAPLFLKLMCRVESEEERGGESRLTTVEDLPLCLSELLIEYWFIYLKDTLFMGTKFSEISDLPNFR